MYFVAVGCSVAGMFGQCSGRTAKANRSKSSDMKLSLQRCSKRVCYKDKGGEAGSTAKEASRPGTHPDTHARTTHKTPLSKRHRAADRQAHVYTHTHTPTHKHNHTAATTPTPVAARQGLAPHSCPRPRECVGRDGSRTLRISPSSYHCTHAAGPTEPDSPTLPLRGGEPQTRPFVTDQ